jgi:glycosyltransferase involved in cell wall biosynthesis
VRILFLQKRLLFPSNTGGRIRTLNLLRHLAQWHDVTYLCNVQAGEERFLEEMKALRLRLETVPWVEATRGSLAFYAHVCRNVFSRYPYTVDKDFDPALQARAAELLAAEPYDLLICDFVQMARNIVGLQAPVKVLFQHNVEAQIYERHAQADPSWLRRKFMGLQWRKMRRFESEAGTWFDAVVAVSQQDRLTFERQYGWKHAAEIDTAVDTEYFHANGVKEEAGRVLFVGSMDWLPNQDGAQHFVKEIWPLIRERHPSAVFQIVGRNPGRSVIRLSAVEGVQVVGTVPDVRPYLAQAAVVVVPLLVGGGTRIKIFEAMSMGKPVVSTSLGAEGLPVVSGQHLIIADPSRDFADSVSALLESPQRRASLGQSAMELVQQRYSAEQVARQFERICLQARDHRCPLSSAK